MECILCICRTDFVLQHQVHSVYLLFRRHLYVFCIYDRKINGKTYCSQHCALPDGCFVADWLRCASLQMGTAYHQQHNRWCKANGSTVDCVSAKEFSQCERFSCGDAG